MKRQKQKAIQQHFYFPHSFSVVRTPFMLGLHMLCLHALLPLSVHYIQYPIRIFYSLLSNLCWTRFQPPATLHRVNKILTAHTLPYLLVNVYLGILSTHAELGVQSEKK